MTAPALRRSARRPTRAGCWAILVGGFLALWPLQQRIDQELAASRPADEGLALPSGTLLRHLSLGYESLLADFYWTRAVQYFGRKRLAGATRFPLLGPLLRITTELDPQLLVAYRFGSVFLAEQPPRGAGDPEEALRLLRRGIVANPEYWRLWEDVGFVYFWDLKDFPAAARAFRTGSERPGAMAWMGVLAAVVAGQGNTFETSRRLWYEIYRQAETTPLRASALEHLMALDAQRQMEELDQLLALFHRKMGRSAVAFEELMSAGYVSTLPRDPSGAFYAIGKDGQATLGPRSRVNLGALR